MRRFGIVSALAVATLGAVTTVAPTRGGADPRVDRDPTVIDQWVGIASRTIDVENGVGIPVPSRAAFFGYVTLAMYDAVVEIEGGFEPYIELPRAHAHASSQVAAATAAYHVLNHYFGQDGWPWPVNPVSADNLAADYGAALAAVPDGVGKVHGRRVGEDAAAALIAARADDGLFATVPQPGTSDVVPGEWNPTPPAFLPMVGASLGFMDPLMIESATQFTLPGPDPIDSPEYAAEFNEVKSLGAVNSTTRSPEQTATALFWTPNVITKMQLAFAARLAPLGLDIAETARAHAILNTGISDTVIACWRAKYDYDYWRPVWAIRLADTDGNAATDPDPNWTPLIATPPYSDYTSGHACGSGASSETFSYYFGADSINVTVPNVAPRAADPPRFFATAAALDAETNAARMLLGIHFRKAMTDGNHLGHRIVAWIVAHHFQAT